MRPAIHAARTGTICVAVIAFTLCGFSAARAQAPAPAGPSSQESFKAAVDLFDAGKWTEALSAFQKFETQWKLSDAVPSAIYYQGWCWFNMDPPKYQEAANVFERLIKQFPKATVAAEATLKQAECYRELKNYTKATGLYRTFQQNYPKHDLMPQAMLGEATMLLRQSDNAGAKTIIQTVRSQYSEDPVAQLDALFLLGQILTDERKFDEAREVYLLIARSRDPRATEALFLQAETRFEAQQYEDAIAYYERIPSKAALLDMIQAQIDMLQKQKPIIVQRGDSLASLQARIDGLYKLGNQTKQRPDLRAAAVFRVANCYQELGKPEEASVVYRYFLGLFPEDKLAADQKDLPEKAHYGLIVTLTERGQGDGADVESVAFDKKYPQSKLKESARFIQAEALFSSDKFEKALAMYKEYLTASKNTDLIESANYRIALCLYGLKQYDRSRDALAEFVKKYPKGKFTPDALFRLGRSYFELSQTATDPKVQQDDLTRAADTYELIRKDFPDSPAAPEVTFQLGYLYSYLGRFDKAAFEKSVAAFQKFANDWPDYTDKTGKPLVPEALYQSARSQVALGNYDAAVADFNKIVESYPDNDLAPYAAFEAASAYAAAKKPAEMITALRAYADKYPTHKSVGDALYAIGQELENQKKPDEAITEYRTLITRAGASDSLSENMRNAAIAAQLRIAALLDAQGKTDEAVADCEKFLAKFNKDALAARAMVIQIGALYRKAKLYDAAYAKLKQLGAQYQQNAAVRIAAASSTIELALAEKKYAIANEAAQKLLADPEKDRLPSSSYVAIGNTLLKTDKFAQARDVFDKSLSLYPNDVRTAPATQLGLGQAQLGLNNPDAAEAAFTKVIATDPQGPGLADATLGLGKVYEARGKTEEAFVKYNWVMQNARGDAAIEAAFRAGQMRFAAKDYKLALPYYLRVQLTAAGPMGEESSFRAAQCHEGLGNVEGARSSYNAYLKRYPTGKFAEDAKKLLAAVPVPKPQPQL